MLHSRLRKISQASQDDVHADSAPHRRTRRSTSPSGSRCRSAISACPTRRWTRASPPRKPRSAPRLVILGHHYQRDEVIKFADYTGDSLQARAAGRQASRRRVHRLLRRALHGRERRRAERRHQQVILPDLAAGCSMADMADADQLEMCWSDLAADGRHPAIDSRHLHQLRRRRSKPSAASTAASSAPRRTRRRR